MPNFKYASEKKEPPTVLDATEVQFVPDPVEIQPQQVLFFFVLTAFAPKCKGDMRTGH